MREIVKSFFRTKRTIIYLLIFCIVIFSIICLKSFINYFDEVVNEYYQTNSFISFISNYKYLEDLNLIDNISNYEIGIMMVPNYDCETLKRSDMIDNNDGFLVSDILWDNFLIDDYYVPVYSSNDYSQNVIENGAILMLPFDSLNTSQKENVENIIGREIIINSLDGTESFTFIINKVVDSPISTLIISDEEYNKIAMDGANKYAYRVYVSNYNEQDLTRLEIMKLNYDLSFGVVIKSRGITYAKNIISLILFLRFGGMLLLAILIIIFAIICNNVLKDEKKNIYIERIIGFNKKQVKLCLLLNMFLLINASIFISFVLSDIIILLINGIFNLNIIFLNIGDGDTLLLVSIIYLIVIIDLTYYSFKIKKVLKLDSFSI